MWYSRDMLFLFVAYLAITLVVAVAFGVSAGGDKYPMPVIRMGALAPLWPLAFPLGVAMLFSALAFYVRTKLGSKD